MTSSSAPAAKKLAADLDPPAAVPVPPFVHNRRFRRRRRPLQPDDCDFHVLTDGSEQQSPAVVCLTLQVTATSKIRYALMGLSESTARLAADQAFSLLDVRAVFLPSSHGCLDGLASLLLTLQQQAGAEHVTVCGPHGTCRTVEAITNLVLSDKTAFPKVRICEVPNSDNGVAVAAKAACWFCIYEDDYLVVHAKSCDNHDNDDSLVVLVYTLLMDADTGKRQSFAIVPGAANVIVGDVEASTTCLDPRQQAQQQQQHAEVSSLANLLASPLPSYCAAAATTAGGERPNKNAAVGVVLDFVLVLNANDTTTTATATTPTATSSTTRAALPLALTSTTPTTSRTCSRAPETVVTQNIFVMNGTGSLPIFVVSSSSSSQGNKQEKKAMLPTIIMDDGLFIRAQYLAQERHKACPFLYPMSSFSSSRTSCTHKLCKNKEDTANGGGSSQSVVQLKEESRRLGKVIADNGTTTNTTKNNDCDHETGVMVRVLTSCSTWRLGGEDAVDRDSYKRNIWNRCAATAAGGGGAAAAAAAAAAASSSISGVEQDDGDMGATDVRARLPMSREAFLGIEMENHGSAHTVMVDENEIDLNDDNDGDGDGAPSLSHHQHCEQAPFPSVPHLLVLGTGCASPSPQRGSSGYALFLPSAISGGHVNDHSTGKEQHLQLKLKLIMECGEGTVTSLQRYLPTNLMQTTSLDEQLCHLSMIWISHAHLDHYGGLPSLLRARQRAIMRTTSRNNVAHNDDDYDERIGAHSTFQKKRQKVESTTADATTPSTLFVVAPAKVLRYVKALLHDDNDGNDDSNNRSSVSFQYQGLTHEQWQVAQQSSSPSSLFSQEQSLYSTRRDPFVLSSLTSVRVDHCPNAHGLLLDLCCVGRLSGNDDATSHNILLVFSGDCRPSSSLIHAVRRHQQRRPQGSSVSSKHSTSCSTTTTAPTDAWWLTLLLHEATFDDDDVELAQRKRHSTISQALWVAHECTAFATLLSHFSQRYHFRPRGGGGGGGGAARTLCARTRARVVAGDDAGASGSGSNRMHKRICSTAMVPDDVNYGNCQDGLWLPLTRQALANVWKLR